MKYMIMMFGEAATMLEVRSTEWIREMIGFMQDLGKELTEAGELIDAQGLADGARARVVSLVDGLVITTDGPYAESKESLIGYWIVDVETDERLMDLASRIVVYSGKVELRPVMDGPPEL
jgi:hypothetical protein